MEYAELRIEMLPPRFSVHDLTIAMPGRLNLRARSLLLVPATGALLRGEVEVETLRLEGAAMRVALPAARVPESATEDAPERPEAWLSDLSAGVDRLLVTSLPRAHMVIADSAVEVVQGENPVVTLTGVHGTWRSGPAGVRAEISGVAGMAASVVVHLEANGDSAQLHADLRELRLAEWVQSLAPGLTGSLGAPRADVVLDVEAGGQDQKLRAAYRVGLRDLQWPGSQGGVLLGTATLAGSAELDSTLRVVLESLQVPRLGLTGKGSLRWEPAAPQVACRLEVEGARWDALRPLWVAAGPTDPTVALVDSLLRGGGARRVEVAVTGPDWGMLTDPARIEVEADLSEVELNLPWVGLELSQVEGRLGFRSGVLTVEQGQGVYRGSRFDQGALRLGPFGEAVPLQLGAELDMDLADLPEVLRKVIADPALHGVLDGFDEVSGRARGRLELAPSVDALQVTVDAAPRDLVLRHRDVPVSLRLDGGQVAYRGGKLAFLDLQGSAGATTFTGVAGHLDLAEVPLLQLDRAEARLALADLGTWLARYDEFLPAGAASTQGDGHLVITEASAAGPLGRPGQWTYHATGTAEDVVAEVPEWGSVAVPAAQVTLQPGRLEVAGATVRWLDGEVAGAGALEWGPDGPGQAAGELGGTLGEQAVARIWERFQLPEDVLPQTPLTLRQVEFGVDAAGAGQIAGRVQTAPGAELSGALEFSPREFSLQEFRVRDGDSELDASLARGSDGWRVSLAGQLHGEALGRIVVGPFPESWSLRGDVQGRWPAGQQWQAGTATGWVDAEQVKVPEWPGLAPRGGTVVRARLRAAERTVEVEELVVRLPEHPVSVSGRVTAGARRLKVALDITAAELDVTPWLPEVGKYASSATSPDSRQDPGPVGGSQGDSTGPELGGTVRLRCERFRARDWQWTPLYADLHLDGDTTTVEVPWAELCGIRTPAFLVRRGEALQVSVRPSARGQSLQPTLACLGREDILATGRFDLDSEFQAEGPAAELLANTSGSFRFRAVDGRIQRYDLLAKVFAVLNVTEVFRGRLPDVVGEGFGYDSLDSVGTVARGVVRMAEGVLDARSMKLLWRGEVDLPAETLDLTLVLAPLKTVDTIVSWIPVVNYLLDDTLIAVPVALTGPLNDPRVVPLSPSAVGEGVLGFVKRTLNLPFHIVDLLKPKDAKP